MKLITYLFAMIVEVVIWLMFLQLSHGTASFIGSIIIFGAFGAIFGRISQYKEDAQ